MTNKIKVVFLGTNGWYDTGTGNTICVLVETPREYIVLDAGNGIYKLDQYIKRSKPIYLFISHFHLDHVVGLHTLAKFKFRQGLTIIVGRSQKRLLGQLTGRQFTVPLNRLPMRVKVQDITAAEKSLPFLESALPLRHPVPCLGYRFAFGGKGLAYVADTGECANAYRLAQNADLLISECAFKTRNRFAQWPHLYPRLAARIAKRAGAKKLALVHFDAEIYRTMRDREEAGKRARSVFKRAVTARDGLEIEL